LPPVGLMLFSLGDVGGLLAGAGVVVVVVVVVGVWFPLVPQAVVNAPIAMSPAPPATAIRRRSTLRAIMRNSYLRVSFLARDIREMIRSSYCHQRRRRGSNTVRGQWPWVVFTNPGSPASTSTSLRPSPTRPSKPYSAAHSLTRRVADARGRAQRAAVSPTTTLSCLVPPGAIA